MAWTAYIDGGSRGNPGPAAAGVHIVNEKSQVVFSAGLFLGRRTNNEAEYAGLLTALDVLLAAGVHEAHIRSDSELLVRQMTGQYRVSAVHLKRLVNEATARIRQIGRCRFEHVRREYNKEADGLANQAMDAVADVVVVDKLNYFAASDRPQPAPPSPPSTRTPTASARSAEVQAGAIQVSVIKPPKAAGCPARTKAGQTYMFTNTVPAGLCVEACAAVIDAVVSLQTAMLEDPSALAPMTITCGRPECGAVFQIKST